jgi:metal-responsive CopG/Arc/MetJ family transcriptional regulator
MGVQNREKSRRSGPPKLYPVRTLVLLPKGVLETIDRVLAKNENRQNFIRAAITAELKRRQ